MLTFRLAHTGKPVTLFLWTAFRKDLMQVLTVALLFAPDLFKMLYHVTYWCLYTVFGMKVTDEMYHLPMLIV